jgi:hypothetical protein
MTETPFSSTSRAILLAVNLDDLVAACDHAVHIRCVYSSSVL